MMRKFTFQRRIPLSFYLILMVCIPLNNQAQSVKRQCVSSYGTIITSSSASFMQTVGQPYNTIAYYGDKNSITQGFQQPVAFKVEPIKSRLMKNLNLTIYPNPAAFSVTIQSGELIENSIIKVMDVNGRLILSEHATQLQKYEINCEAWKNGTYIITVSDKNNNKSTHKLTINK